MHKILANTVFLGKEIIYLTECHSTNDVATEMFKSQKVREGSIIFTEKQTKGKGQRGNRWFSEPGLNLTFSIVLTPHFLDVTEQFELNMAVSLGVHQAITEYLDGIKIKWPNDFIHLDKGKLGGMLIENSINNAGIEVSVVGIGLNVNQEEFPFPQATSMSIIAGAKLDKEEFFRILVTRIEKFYLKLKKKEFAIIRELYLANLYRLGEWEMFDDGEKFLGKIIGISTEGKLMIEKQTKSVYCYSFKEIRFI